MRKKSFIVGVVALFGVFLVGCGGSSTPKASSSNTTAPAKATTAPSGGATTVASGSQTSGGTVDLCTVITAAVVMDVTKVSSATRPSGAAGCQYNGSGGLLVSVQQAKLTKADQATFDAYVKGQESGTTTKISGVGDGDGASATHDINVTVYGHKGTAVVAVTVFNDATDPAGSAKALAAKAIAAL